MFSGTARAAPVRRAVGPIVSVLLFGAVVAFALTSVAVLDPTLWGRVGSSSLAALPRVLFGKGAFWVILGLAIVLPAVLSGHYQIIGPKVFSHRGRQYRVFSVATRINHWVAAGSCTLLVLSGLTMMCGGTWGFGEALAKGPVVRSAWAVHAWTAIVFVASALFMLVNWARDMLPRWHDLKWMRIAGGYLSAEKKPVPAHKFNAGQKSWFWLATLGGMMAALTGLIIHRFRGGLEFLNMVALIHHVIAAAIVAMFVVHVYMAVFAIKGSLGSMLHGNKSEEEMAILHSLYHRELQSAPVAPREDV